MKKNLIGNRLRLLVLSLLLIQGCGQQSGEFSAVTGGIDSNTFQYQPVIVGIWQDYQIEEDATFWIFEANNDFLLGDLHPDNAIWAHDCGTYTLSGNTLTLFLFGEQFSYEIEISGGTITISSGGSSFEFYRSQRDSFINDCD